MIYIHPNDVKQIVDFIADMPDGAKAYLHDVITTQNHIANTEQIKHLASLCPKHWRFEWIDNFCTYTLQTTDNMALCHILTDSGITITNEAEEERPFDEEEEEEEIDEADYDEDLWTIENREYNRVIAEGLGLR